jgi:periplasmic nitrate reductase NapD
MPAIRWLSAGYPFGLIPHFGLSAVSYSGGCMNISSAIVIPQNDQVSVVVDALAQFNGVEVAAVSPEGKIIVTIETEGDKETIQTFECISTMPGVLSAAMVYHQLETDPELEISMAA